jgi:hypothetical protein
MRYTCSIMTQWPDTLGNAVSKETIKASDLRRIPHLTDCPHWDRAVFIGQVAYAVKVANYDGGLVQYEGRTYYVNRSQIEALRSFVRWNLRKTIKVVEE